MVTCPLSRLLQKPRSIRTRTAMVEESMQGQMICRMPRSQISRASASTCSSMGLSASRRCIPSTQSSLSTPSSLPNVVISPSGFRNCLNASSLINCCSAGDNPSVVIRNSFLSSWELSLYLIGSRENQVRSAIEYLACMGDKQYTLLFAAFPFPGINVPVVCIAQVHEPAAFFGYASCQRDLDARSFNAAGFLVGSRPFDMRAVRENTARNIFPAFPLFEKIIPHMITDLVAQLPMRVGYLREMRRVDNDLTAIGNRWLCFVHGFGRCPQVIVNCRWHGEHAFKELLHTDDIEVCREIGCLAPGVKVTANKETIEFRAFKHQRYAEQRSFYKFCCTVDDASYACRLEADGLHTRDQRTEPVGEVDDIRSRYTREEILGPT